MKMMVLFTAFESIIGPDSVARLRAQVAEAMKRIGQSGKLESGGIFADRRGGYMILNINEAEEMNELFGGDLLDNFRIESHPLFSFDRLAKFFEEDKGK